MSALSLLYGRLTWQVVTVRSPLERCTRLARMLPPEVPEQALLCGSGFSGQPALATVLIQDAHLPQQDPPRRGALAARYHAVYR